MTEDVYSMLNAANVIRPVRELVKAGKVELKEGKLYFKTHEDPDRCWQLVNPDEERDCNRWNNVYFQIYGVIPKACRGCWKVVVKVPHLAGLFQLLKEMQAMDFHSKCGVDKRWAFGGYGQCVGFFYTPLNGGLNGGRRLYKAVKDHLDKALKEPYEIYLKRGCTEMEYRLPSSDWDKHAKQFDAQEKMLDAHIVIPKDSKVEHEMSIFNTHQNWIFWRAQLQDPTYHLFTGGNLFWPKPVTYHDSEHKASDFANGILEGVDE